MYAFQVVGYHKSGKTTTVKQLINRLKIAGNSVASIKDIHQEDFSIDPPNTNTYVHRLAGADLVVARAENETDFLYQHQMDFLAIARKISADWLVVEGFKDFPLPKIICGKTEAEIEELIDQRTFAISGVISSSMQQYQGIPVFDPLDATSANQLWELTMSRVFPMLPYVDDKCCQLCGATCSEMVALIIQGQKTYADCLINRTTVNLKIDDSQIPIVPFVQNILKNNVLAVVSELAGWEKGKRIEITIE